MSEPSEPFKFTIGPFSQHPFNINKWKVIQEMIYCLNSSNEEETKPYVQEFLQFLLELNTYPDYNEYFGDQSAKQFFYNDSFAKNAKNLIITRRFNDPSLLEMSNSILLNLLKFWVKAFKEDDPHLVEMATVILDPSQYYYKLNNLEVLATSTLSAFGLEPSREKKEWISTIKQGDIVDCVKHEQTCNRMCWLPAKVVTVMESYLKIYFLHDKSKGFKYVHKENHTNQIAPYQSKCKDFQWRLDLKAEDEIDACSRSGVWYHSTVLDEKEVDDEEDNNTKIKVVLVGFRVYSDDGNEIEDTGERYFGLSSQHDEWIQITDPRIAKSGTMARKGDIPQFSSDDAEVDDTNDYVYSSDKDDERIYAVPRPSCCRSTWMIKMINEFGRLGGFKMIINRISDVENWAPIEIVTLLLKFIGNIAPLLHREFANEYIPALKSAVWKNLLQSPESNIRNFSKEKLDDIIQAFETLLKRLYTKNERYEMLETLTLQVCVICFDSNFLERKLQGLKSLNEMISYLQIGTLRYTTTESMNVFLKRNQIFEKIFGPKGHTQLIQRSSDLLRYMVAEGVMGLPELESTWMATRKGDTESKLAIYKLISDLFFSLKDDQIEFILGKVAEIDPSEMIPDEIELVYELCRFCSNSEFFSKKAGRFYWKIICEPENMYTPEIRESTLSKFCYLMKNYDMKEERINVLYDCVDNIEKDVAVLESLKILFRLIDSYPTKENSIEKFSKSSCIRHLCEKKDMLVFLLKNLQQFKADIKKKIETSFPQGTVITEEKLDSLLPTRASYITHITERLQFLHFIVNNIARDDAELNYKILSELWDLIIRDALVLTERNPVYKWIQQMADLKHRFPTSFVEELRKFFTSKMIVKEDYENVNSQGFDCLKGVFLLINEKTGKLSQTNQTGGHHDHTRRYAYARSECILEIGGGNPEKETKEKEFEYVVDTSPEELEGIQSIWDLTLIATSDEVAEKARILLNELYFHTSDNLKDEIAAIRGQYLKKCVENLQAVLSTKEEEKNAVFNSKCLRCISMITKILDESEKRGVGSLKSHSALIKGELLTFGVKNEGFSNVEFFKTIEIRMHSNSTIYELRCKLAKIFDTDWDRVKILRYQHREIKDNENGWTLGDIRLRSGEELVVERKPKSMAPVVPESLVDSNGVLNPKLRKILIGWFKEYSTDGRMSRKQCENLMYACDRTDSYENPDDKAREIFLHNDIYGEGTLTQEQFVDFYHTKAIQRPSRVWGDLSGRNYQVNLKVYNDAEDDAVDFTALPRYILSTNTEYFQTFFSLLDFGGKVAIEAWKLLNRLPTSHEVFADIVKLKGIRDSQAEEKDWSNVFDAGSSFKLLYALQVIENLMENENDSEAEQSSQEANSLWARDPELVQYKKTWQADFIYYGGFDHLFKIFHNYSAKDHKTFGIFDKNILSFILKILCNYLTATFAGSVKNIYQSLSFIRLFHLDLNFIQDYMDRRAKNEAPSNQAPEDDKNKQDDLKIEETEEFKLLVQRLQEELGSRILSTIDLKEMIKVISELGYDILTQTADLESEERTILEYSLSILVSIFLYDPQTIKYFIELGKDGPRSSNKFIVEGIFCNSANIRSYFSHAIFVLIRESNEVESTKLTTHFIQLFLNNLPSFEDSKRSDCNQYFEILCKLIETAYSKNNSQLNEDTLNFKELIGFIVQRIQNHVSTEDRSNLHIIDKTLFGLLQLCETIVSVKPELKDVLGDPEKYNLVKEIFTVCLFDVRDTEDVFHDLIKIKGSYNSSQNSVKCKSNESRQIAYKLLLTLCKGHQANLSILLSLLESQVGSILKLSSKQESSSSSSYAVQSEPKSTYGYVGIRNLSCICYMNAMLQQFFMTPTFRYGILAADDKKAPNWNKDQKGNTIDDNLLHQIQKMFGFLELSDQHDYNPSEFCFTFKDHSGQPVNIAVQQDTQEFLNMIFDRLESGLKQTPFKHILQGVYGGKTTNQTLCHGCGTLREKEDIFYNLSVEVKNMKNINESFEKLIQGETIEDYYCESCQTKNNITKRTCISSLPNVLIVHLQRIIFDLDTLMNKKINSRLEFPFELNMEPYTKEGLAKKDKSKKKGKQEQKKSMEEDYGTQGETDDMRKSDEDLNLSKTKDSVGKSSPEKEEDAKENEKEREKEYYQFKLVGVLVHNGTAEYGHYYSYINTNREDLRTRGTASSEKDKWLEFNDSYIRSFNTKSIEEECFGGESNYTFDDNWQNFSKEDSKNAYILVYERVTKDPLELIVENEEDEAYLKRSLNIEEIQAENPNAVQIVKEEVEAADGEKKTIMKYLCDYYSLRGFVPGHIHKKVWESNNKFMFERHIYSHEFFGFLKEIYYNLQIPDLDKPYYSVVHPASTKLDADTKQNLKTLIQILSNIFFELLVKLEEKTEIIGELAQILRNLMSLVPEAAYNFFITFIANDEKFIPNLLIANSSRSVRHFTSSVVIHILNILIVYFQLSLDLSQLEKDKSDLSSLTEERQASVQVESLLVRFLNHLIALIPTEVSKNWAKMTQYFEFWKNFTMSGGDPNFSYLYQKEFIAVLIDFYLGVKSPLIGFSDKKNNPCNKNIGLELNSIVETLAILVQRAKIILPSGAIPPVSLAHQGYLMHELSNNDLICLKSPEFYDRAIKDNCDPNALALIIQSFAAENEELSVALARVLLDRINKAASDELRSSLEAMSYFLTIRDHLQTKRIELVFGFPEPEVTTSSIGHQSVKSYGIFGNYSLDMQVVNYDSPVRSTHHYSFINWMLYNRKRVENNAMTCLKQLLILANCNDVIFRYVVSLPPPSYNFAKFTDWIPEFFEYYFEECRRYSLTSNEQLGRETWIFWELVEKKVNQALEAHERDLQQALLGDDFERIDETQSTNRTETQITESPSPNRVHEVLEADSEVTENHKENKDTVLRGFFPNYIIGKTFKSEEMVLKMNQEKTNWDELSVTVQGYEEYCYITESKPTGTGNQAFPGYIMENCLFRHFQLNYNSPLSLFIQPRGVVPGVDHYMDIQDTLQGEIEGALAPPSESTQMFTNPMQHNLKMRLADDIDQDEEEEETVETRQEEEPQREQNEDYVIDITRELNMRENYTFDFEVNPVVRSFYVHNDSVYNVTCHFEIVPKPNTFLNFRYPSGCVPIVVKAGRHLSILTIFKIFPTLGWGEYEIKCEIKRENESHSERHSPAHLHLIHLKNL